MRSSLTWVVVAGVGLLAALAVGDALRPNAQSHPAAASISSGTTVSKAPTLLDTLRSESVSGFLLYSDQDCRLHSLLLPRMVDSVVRDENGANVVRCRFDVVGGRIVAGQSNAPDGLAVRHGEVVSGRHVVLTHRDLLRAAYRHPTLVGLSRSIPLRIRVTGLSSFGVRRPVVAMAITARDIEPHFLVALFAGSRIEAVAASFRGPYFHLFTSLDGALIGSEDGTVITRTGRTIDPPQGLPASRAIAFSPDDRWMVRVNGTSTFLVSSPGGSQPVRVIRLPIPARDLVWEPVTSGTSIGPPIRR